MRYLINFSYNGSYFYGFQRQNSLKTVQGIIEDALTKLNKKEVFIHASGRTDKGVHAINQYAHFDLDKKVKLYNLRKYLNRSFNGEIYIKDIIEVKDNFHARYNVKSKKYSYYINMGDYNPVKKDYEYQLCKKLNIDKMIKASKFLIGEHDFRSFATDNSLKDNTVREIYDIIFEETDDILKIIFIGNGFLRKMIRNIVSILVDIGLEKKDVNYLEDVLNMRERIGNLGSVPGGGLYLEDVSYN